MIRTGSLDRWSDVYALVVWRRWITNTARLIGLVAVAIATLSWSKVAVSNWMLTVGLTIAALLCATLAAAAPEEPSVSDQRVLEYVAKHEATARMRLYMWNNRILNGGGVPAGWLKQPGGDSSSSGGSYSDGPSEKTWRLWLAGVFRATALALTGAIAGFAVATWLSTDVWRGVVLWGIGAALLWVTVAFAGGASSMRGPVGRRLVCVALLPVGAISPGGLFGAVFGSGPGFLIAMAVSAVLTAVAGCTMFSGRPQYLASLLWKPVWVIARKSIYRARGLRSEDAEAARRRLSDDQGANRQEHSDIQDLVRELSELSATLQHETSSNRQCGPERRTWWFSRR